MLNRIKVVFCPFLGINLLEFFQEEEFKESNVPIAIMLVPKHMSPIHSFSFIFESENSITSEDIELANNL